MKFDGDDDEIPSEAVYCHTLCEVELSPAIEGPNSIVRPD